MAEDTKASRRSLRWMVGGGVAAVVLVLVGVLSVRALRSDDDDQDGSSSSSPEFRSVTSLCDTVDFTPVLQVFPFSVAQIQEDARDGRLHSTSCLLDRDTVIELGPRDTGPQGQMTTHAFIYDTPDAARSRYDAHVQTQMIGQSGFRSGPDGPWDDSSITRRQSTSTGGMFSSSDVTLVVLDDVLMLNLRLAISSNGPTPALDDQEAALVQLADNMRQVLRR